MKWTPRNTVNIVLVLICFLTPLILGALDGSGTIQGAWITPMQAAFGGCLVGLVTPGSPIGRYLDMLFPEDSGAAKTAPGATSGQDGAAVVAELEKTSEPTRPQRIPPGGPT